MSSVILDFQVSHSLLKIDKLGGRMLRSGWTERWQTMTGGISLLGRGGALGGAQLGPPADITQVFGLA